MEDCLFCKIVEGIIPCEKVFENEYVLAFKDIHPVAPVHILVIPKIHITSLNDVNLNNIKYINEIFLSMSQIAKIVNVYDSGYRVITNIGNDGGQLVKHLHYHLIGGKHLGPKIVNE